MSDPKRHHYLPEFYQRRWVNADNEVTVYRRFPSESVSKLMRIEPIGVT